MERANRIYVIYRPPYKQTPADTQERENQERYVAALREEAKKLFKSPFQRNVKIIIEYNRNQGRADSMNILGGIADALEEIAYLNDSQITEIHYVERRGVQDEYWIEVHPL